MAPSTAVPLHLEHGRSLVDLGSALRAGNRPFEARVPLRHGMDIAHRCGALPLAQRAREELRATGARPRRLLHTGVDSLTASERRVAQMAAEKLSNPKIAQALFVTRKIVETHLSHVYRKLGIASRQQLAERLADASTSADHG